MLFQFKRTLVLIYLLGVGIGLTVWGLSEIRQLRLLAKDGIVAEGKVVDHSEGHYSKRSSSYRLTVEYKPGEGAMLRKSMAVDGHVYRAAVASGTVPLRWLPSDPEICSAGDPIRFPYYCILAVGILQCVLGVFLLCRGPKDPTAAVAPAAFASCTADPAHSGR